MIPVFIDRKSAEFAGELFFKSLGAKLCWPFKSIVANFLYVVFFALPTFGLVTALLVALGYSWLSLLITAIYLTVGLLKARTGLGLFQVGMLVLMAHSWFIVQLGLKPFGIHFPSEVGPVISLVIALFVMKVPKAETTEDDASPTHV